MQGVGDILLKENALKPRHTNTYGSRLISKEAQSKIDEAPCTDGWDCTEIELQREALKIKKDRTYALISGDRIDEAAVIIL